MGGSVVRGGAVGGGATARVSLMVVSRSTVAPARGLWAITVPDGCELSRLGELRLPEAGVLGNSDRSGPSETVEVRNVRLAGRILDGDLAVQRYRRAFLRRDARHLAGLGVRVFTLRRDCFDVAELQILQSVLDVFDVLSDQAFGDGGALGTLVQA